MAYVKWAFRLIVFIGIGAFLCYNLPSRDVVRIVGTEVVREDVRVKDANGNEIVQTHDVRQIHAVQPNGTERVYRNEDTGWGWPPYFKFDTANLAAAADDARSTKDAPEWVVVRHYGWRIPMLSMFPNALSMRPASGPDENLFPWGNVILLTGLAAIVLLIRRLFLIMFERHVDPVIEELDHELDESRSWWRRQWRRVFRRGA